jgi:hypothetical protein
VQLPSHHVGRTPLRWPGSTTGATGRGSARSGSAPSRPEKWSGGRSTVSVLSAGRSTGCVGGWECSLRRPPDRRCR